MLIKEILKIRSDNKTAHKRMQMSFAIDTDLVIRFNQVANQYGHGAKKMFIEYALKKILDELENKTD